MEDEGERERFISSILCFNAEEGVCLEVDFFRMETGDEAASILFGVVVGLAAVAGLRDAVERETMTGR
jgi:hypothetical protein